MGRGGAKEVAYVCSVSAWKGPSRTLSLFRLLHEVIYENGANTRKEGRFTLKRRAGGSTMEWGGKRWEHSRSKVLS